MIVFAYIAFIISVNHLGWDLSERDALLLFGAFIIGSALDWLRSMWAAHRAGRGSRG